MRLLYVSPETPLTADGAVHLPSKTLEALLEYSGHWPGEVLIAAAPPLRASAVPAGWAPVPEALTIVPTTDPAAAARQMRPAVVLALHKPASRALLDAAAPVVLTTENTIAERTRQQLIASASPWAKARIIAGAARLGTALRTDARRAAGLQCNGFAAWDAYGRAHDGALFFHDHRIRALDLAAAAATPPWDGTGRLRLAFSGRLTAIKGPQFALELARRLHRAGAPADLVFLGEGDLAAELADDAPPNTEFLGALDFAAAWKPHVREHVDLAVLPHPQGDPSCTYFEFLGSGTPVLGFRNATLDPLVTTSGSGWAVRPGDVDALVERVMTLIGRPDQLSEARARGLKYMSDQPFEEVSRRRVAHLLRHSRS